MNLVLTGQQPLNLHPHLQQQKTLSPPLLLPQPHPHHHQLHPLLHQHHALLQQQQLHQPHGMFLGINPLLLGLQQQQLQQFNNQTGAANSAANKRRFDVAFSGQEGYFGFKRGFFR